MLTIMYQGAQCVDFAALLSSYSVPEFASPYRSTIPLLAYWKDPNQGLREFTAFLGVTPGDEAVLTFEATLDAQDGRGRPSQTDLLIATGGQVIAIEAKHTEPPYKTVREWLGTPATENRTQVLAGWLRVIAQATGTLLTDNAVSDCTYQLIHRTASACFPTVSHRTVAYLGFELSAKARDGYQEQMTQLADLLNRPAGLEFALVTVGLTKSRQYQCLQDAWDAGNRDLSSSILWGLRAGSLMEFKPPVLTRC
jgi:hypothetical protein